MERGTVNFREGKVRTLLRENRRAARQEERENRLREREIQRERVPFVVVIPRDEEEERRNFAPFVSNSPPVPTVARRLERERQQAQMLELVPLNSQINDPALVSPSVDEGIRFEISPTALEVTSRRQVREVPVVHEAVQTDAVVGPSAAVSRTLEWSIFQVWNNLAFATCSVPNRVSFDEQQGKYVLKHSRLQQFFYGTQTVVAFVDMMSWWRTFKIILDGPSNPLKYVKFAGLVVKGVALLSQVKTTAFRMKDILRLHNLALEHEAEISSYKINMGKGMTIIFIMGYSVYLVGYSTLTTAIKLFVDEMTWDYGLAEIVQSFACHARKIFTWTSAEDCPYILPSLTDLPLKEFLYSGLGMYTYISSLLLKQHTTLQIMTSCLTLLQMSCTLTGAPSDELPPIEKNRVERSRNMNDGNSRVVQPHVHSPATNARNSRTKFLFIERSAEIISSFIGLLLVVKMVDVACDLPKCLDYMFNFHSTTVIPLAIDIFILLLALFAACVSALQISELKGQVGDPNSAEEFSHDFKGLKQYLDHVLRKKVGIGYRGLFVITFQTMVVYCTSVAGFVAFTHENEKKQTEK